MADGLQLSARAVAGLLAQMLGPAVYDALIPRHGGLRGLVSAAYPVPWQVVSGPHPEPWQVVGGQGVPWHTVRPRESYALTLADAHIQEFLALDRAGAVFGGEVAARGLERSVQLVMEIDELCPRWPRWPKDWPPPPAPPGAREEMSPTELFVFGARFLAASEVMEQGRLQEALTGLGEKALGLSLQG